ncbi:Chromosome partition protein Smc [Carpediemonas membranifera]|uniref:Chromosome partition protein Smc n=1 Tax=Carpediemonas membranifera TaxID=201153 RepID=A0A8J6B4K5_9EUKA|nr:Chromosome partition protein Smc [Carpediemonas membranifera]|eukprot:KAG9395568.1 Chromosome partition protein Smc [Carpediemonas membranifera]
MHDEATTLATEYHALETTLASLADEKARLSSYYSLRVQQLEEERLAAERVAAYYAKDRAAPPRLTASALPPRCPVEGKVAWTQTEASVVLEEDFQASKATWEANSSRAMNLLSDSVSEMESTRRELLAREQELDRVKAEAKARHDALELRLQHERMEARQELDSATMKHEKERRAMTSKLVAATAEADQLRAELKTHIGRNRLDTVALRNMVKERDDLAAEANELRQEIDANRRELGQTTDELRATKLNLQVVEERTRVETQRFTDMQLPESAWMKDRAALQAALKDARQTLADEREAWADEKRELVEGWNARLHALCRAVDTINAGAEVLDGIPLPTSPPRRASPVRTASPLSRTQPTRVTRVVRRDNGRGQNAAQGPKTVSAPASGAVRKPRVRDSPAPMTGEVRVTSRASSTGFRVLPNARAK